MGITAKERELLTNSRRGCYMSCPRRHLFAYELGLRPRTDMPALRIGSCVHTALDLHNKGANTGQAISEALASFVQDEWDDPERIAAMLTGYWWRWQNDVTVAVASELTLYMPLTNPDTGLPSRTFTVAMKADVIVTLHDSRLALMEHKTTSEDIAPDSDYWKRLRIDAQISTYMLGARHNGYDVQTVVYDVLRKPLLRPKQVPMLDDQGLKIVRDAATGERLFKKDGNPRLSAEAGMKLDVRGEEPHEYQARLMDDIYSRPDYYYARREIPRIKSDLEDAQRDLWNVAKLIRESQLNNWWPRNDHACKGFGTCPYFRLCVEGYDPKTGEVPDGFEFVSELHPELKGE